MTSAPPRNPDGDGPPEIMYVISDLSVGGAERQLVEVAPALIERGWHVSVYSVYGSGPAHKELQQRGVVVILPPASRPSAPLVSAVHAFFLSRMGWHLFRTLRRRKPAIVHFVLPGAYLAGAPVALAAGVKRRVMSRRSLNIYQVSGFLRFVERWLHRRMQAIVANSRAVIDELKSEGAPGDRLALIYNGVVPNPAQETRGAMRQSLAIPRDVVTLCIVANLIPYKGHKDLLDALALADGKISPWHLLIVGRDDGVGGSLKEQVRHLGLDGKVSFLGSRADVPQILAASDVGLLCSHQESFSNAILESMAAGLPMVVTDVGGNAEAVINGETGFVVPARTPAALADAIGRLTASGKLRRELGEAGRRRAAEHFGVQSCIERHHALYAALLDGRVPVNLGPQLAGGGVVR